MRTGVGGNDGCASDHMTIRGFLFRSATLAFRLAFEHLDNLGLIPGHQLKIAIL